MKDIYKQKVDDTIEMMSTRVKIVQEMVTGDRLLILSSKYLFEGSSRWIRKSTRNCTERINNEIQNITFRIIEALFVAFKFCFLFGKWIIETILWASLSVMLMKKFIRIAKTNHELVIFTTIGKR